jgi:hypothetical protein
LDWVKENIWKSPDDNKTIKEANRREAMAKAEEREIKVLRLKGELLPRDASLQLLRILVAEARARLLGLPRRLAETLSALSDPKEIESLLREDVNRLLDDLGKPLDDAKRRTKSRTHTPRTSARLETTR